jgi:hypothetical protein
MPANHFHEAQSTPDTQPFQCSHSCLAIGQYGVLYMILVVSSLNLVSMLITLALFSLVLTYQVYSQGSGKPRGHSWQSRTQTIGVVSYLIVHAYAYFHCAVFSCCPSNRRCASSITFTHLPTDCFLCLLPRPVFLSAVGALWN